MNLEFLAKTLEVVGEILLGIIILAVHWRIIKERKIDTEVLKQMKGEQIIGIFGVILILAGYFLEAFF